MEGGSSSHGAGNDTDLAKDATAPGPTVEQPVVSTDGREVVSYAPVLASEDNMATPSDKQPQQHSPRSPLSAGVTSQAGFTTPQLHEKIPSPAILSKAKLPSLAGVAPHIPGAAGDMATPALLPPLSTKSGGWKTGVGPISQKEVAGSQGAMSGAIPPTGHANNPNPHWSKGSSGSSAEGSRNGSSGKTPVDSGESPKGKTPIETTKGGATETAGSPDKNEPAVGRRSSTFRSAAMAVMAVKNVQQYRRSSVALHTDLLRAFVPDMLIRVSTKIKQKRDIFIIFCFGRLDCVNKSGTYCMYNNLMPQCTSPGCTRSRCSRPPLLHSSKSTP